MVFISETHSRSEQLVYHSRILGAYFCEIHREAFVLEDGVLKGTWLRQRGQVCDLELWKFGVLMEKGLRRGTNGLIGLSVDFISWSIWVIQTCTLSYQTASIKHTIRPSCASSMVFLTFNLRPMACIYITLFLVTLWCWRLNRFSEGISTR
jgi:hypothetical protein